MFQDRYRLFPRLAEGAELSEDCSQCVGKYRGLGEVLCPRSADEENPKQKVDVLMPTGVQVSMGQSTR